ncbi:MAG: GGDEF domain-containing protein [Brevinematales bacterium]|jgi:diguanylate cyclase (GGDEF)-like protein
MEKSPGTKDYFPRKVADAINTMLAYWDKNRICRFANHAYLAWAGKSSVDMIDKMAIQELQEPFYQANLPYIDAAYSGKTQIFESDIKDPAGNIKHCIVTYTPDIENGKVMGIIVHIADVSFLKNLEMACQEARGKAEELAMHDVLTGLPNRAFLLDRIRMGISETERKGLKLSIFMIDIDNFKKINDKHGHLTGDKVLIEIALRLKSVIREYDTVSRIGGDEFVILANEIESREQVELMAGRLLEFATVPLIDNKVIIRPTISIGIAMYPEDGRTPEKLIKNADIALYISKKSGKNLYSFK